MLSFTCVPSIVIYTKINNPSPYGSTSTQISSSRMQKKEENNERDKKTPWTQCPTPYSLSYTLNVIVE